MGEDINDILQSFGLEPITDANDNSNDLGVQNTLMALIQQLYAVVDTFNSTAITTGDLGYKDVADTCTNYAQDTLNKITFLQYLVQSLAPTVERVQNPFNNNEITII